MPERRRAVLPRPLPWRVCFTLAKVVALTPFGKKLRSEK